MPEALHSSITGIRHEACAAGNSSRTASTVAGMSPLKPSPNAAATVNSPTSSCVTRNSDIVAAWQIEPIITARSPPMRSEINPHTWRLRNAVPSSTDSIAAPCDALMPRSVQKATRWLCGIAIGTQHMKIAAASIANTTFGGQPRTLLSLPFAPVVDRQRQFRAAP